MFGPQNHGGALQSRFSRKHLSRMKNQDGHCTADAVGEKERFNVKTAATTTTSICLRGAHKMKTDVKTATTTTSALERRTKIQMVASERSRRDRPFHRHITRCRENHITLS